jgi:hypothetical protein
MIDFLKTLHPTKLIMRYMPETGNADWLNEPLESDDDISLAGRAFIVRKEIYLPELAEQLQLMDACYLFAVGELEGEYFLMDRRFLGIKYNLYLHKSLKFRRPFFIAEKNIPIFREFNDYGLHDIRVGGDDPNAIPSEVFEDMLCNFPNTYELKKYARARVSGVLRNYIPLNQDFAAKYQKYLEKKASAKGSAPREQFNEYETEKFSALIVKLETMLGNAAAYTERQWQAEILQLIQFIYPKYICAFPEAHVKDSVANKDRQIDFLLVDASGYVDAIEIKKH